jgi:hypothetical protein
VAARSTTTAGAAAAAAAGLAVAGGSLAPLGRRGCGDRREIDGFDGGAWNLVADVALDVGQ